MRFQSCSVGQVDSMGRDIINGGPSIVAGRRVGCETSCITKNAAFRRRVCEDRPRRVRHAKKLLEKRAIIGGGGWEEGVSVLLRYSAARRRGAMACRRSQLGGTRYWQRCALSKLGNGPSRLRQDVFRLCGCSGGCRQN